MWLWISVDIIRHVDIIIQGLCFICAAIVYCRLYFIVRRHTNQMQALQVQQLEQNGEMTNVARQKKSAISMFYVYLVLLVCYLPNYFALVVSISSAPTAPLNNISSLYKWLYLLTLQLLNSSLNPVIYCWKMRNIRQTILGILRNIFSSFSSSK